MSEDGSILLFLRREESFLLCPESYHCMTVCVYVCEGKRAREGKMFVSRQGHRTRVCVDIPMQSLIPDSS